jgi:hypothetical protein
MIAVPSTAPASSVTVHHMYENESFLFLGTTQYQQALVIRSLPASTMYPQVARLLVLVHAVGP